jgi:hypothetical protein
VLIVCVSISEVTKPYDNSTVLDALSSCVVVYLPRTRPTSQMTKNAERAQRRKRPTTFILLWENCLSGNMDLLLPKLLRSGLLDGIDKEGFRNGKGDTHSRVLCKLFALHNVDTLQRAFEDYKKLHGVAASIKEKEAVDAGFFPVFYAIAAKEVQALKFSDKFTAETLNQKPGTRVALMLVLIDRHQQSTSKATSRAPATTKPLRGDISRNKKGVVKTPLKATHDVERVGKRPSEEGHEDSSATDERLRIVEKENENLKREVARLKQAIVLVQDEVDRWEGKYGWLEDEESRNTAFQSEEEDGKRLSLLLAQLASSERHSMSLKKRQAALVLRCRNCPQCSSVIESQF